MCTVTYLPLSHGGFILTSTRDEKTSRKPAHSPALHELHGRQVYFPRDQDASGTWISSGPDAHTLCLLNGGFVVHEPDPPYRRSRGLVLLDFYSYNDLARYRDSYDFSGIEPFTLLIIAESEPFLHELRWDGETVHDKAYPTDMPGIWSSVTLYQDDVIRQRRSWFEEWLDTAPEFTPESAIQFHTTAGSGDIRNDILMNRENTIRTVSITCLVRDNTRHEFHYEDMISSRTFTCPVS